MHPMPMTMAVASAAENEEINQHEQKMIFMLQ